MKNMVNLNSTKVFIKLKIISTALLYVLSMKLFSGCA